VKEIVASVCVIGTGLQPMQLAMFASGRPKRSCG
jgi:hypothetical protein